MGKRRKTARVPAVPKVTEDVLEVLDAQLKVDWAVFRFYLLLGIHGSAARVRCL